MALFFHTVYDPFGIDLTASNRASSPLLGIDKIILLVDSAGVFKTFYVILNVFAVRSYSVAVQHDVTNSILETLRVG